MPASYGSSQPSNPEIRFSTVAGNVSQFPVKLAAPVDRPPHRDIGPSVRRYEIPRCRRYRQSACCGALPISIMQDAPEYALDVGFSRVISASISSRGLVDIARIRNDKPATGPDDPVKFCCPFIKVHPMEGRSHRQKIEQ